MRKELANSAKHRILVRDQLLGAAHFFVAKDSLLDRARLGRAEHDPCQLDFSGQTLLGVGCCSNSLLLAPTAE